MNWFVDLFCCEQSNIPKALESFQEAVDNSLQREIKLLALHEVGWCHLIQLDYENAQKTFVQLRTGSRWSRSFYTYLLIICLGATGKIKDCLLILQFHELLKSSPQKGAQLEVFMNRRAKLFPMMNDELTTKTTSFWKMFVYELLFFWNALPSCNRINLEQIIRGKYLTRFNSTCLGHSHPFRCHSTLWCFFRLWDGRGWADAWLGVVDRRWMLQHFEQLRWCHK